MNGDNSEQNERLTRKHIRTLVFTQEKVNENDRLMETIQDLKREVERLRNSNRESSSVSLKSTNMDSTEALQQINQKCLERADEINKSLIRQHELEIERLLETHAEEKRIMLNEISELKKTLFEERESHKALSAEYDEMRGQLDHSRVEWQRVESEGDQKVLLLEKTLQQLEQRLFSFKAMEQQMKQLQEERHKMLQKLSELDSLATNLQKSLKEKETQLEMTTRKYASQQENDEKLWSGRLQDVRDKLEVECRRSASFEQLLQTKDCQIESLKSKLEEMRRLAEQLSEEARRNRESRSSLQMESNFKEFIQVKKQLSESQAEVDRLKAQVKVLSRGQIFSLKGEKK